ncbi:Uncharacterised protein [Yersinia frederiksenii]|nr:Uncharacterised protein [Yersinia frederiksenii]
MTNYWILPKPEMTNKTVSSVIVAGSSGTDSAQRPERILIREDREHCPSLKWPVR